MCLQCCHLTRLFFNKTPPSHTYGKRHLRTDFQSFKLFLYMTKPKSFHCMPCWTLANLAWLAISNEELHNTTALCRENISPVIESCHIYIRVICNTHATGKEQCGVHMCEMMSRKQFDIFVSVCKPLVIGEHKGLKYSMAINIFYWVVCERFFVQSFTLQIDI